jgi:hypothetical protein
MRSPQAAVAQRDLEQGTHFGNVVLRIGRGS